MNHGQPKLTIHMMVTWTWRTMTTSSPIMYFVTSGEGYIQVQKFLVFFFYFCEFLSKIPNFAKVMNLAILWAQNSCIQILIKGLSRAKL
jgi:hypothetical protein